MENLDSVISLWRIFCLFVCLFVSTGHLLGWSQTSNSSSWVALTPQFFISLAGVCPVYTWINESESDSRSVVSDYLWYHGLAHQAPLSMEFSRQDTGVGNCCLLQRMFPSPGDCANPGIEPRSPTLKHILYHLSHRETHIVQRSDQNLKRVFKHIGVWGSPSAILFFLGFLLHFPEADLVLFTVC